MRIVVTGLHGQVVSALRARAQTLGVDVVAVGRPELDLARYGTALTALTHVRPDAIVNAAAYTAVDRAEKETTLAYQINATGAGEVASAAQRLRVPLVHLSTDYVFDGKKATPYVETDPISPLNVYGETKAAGEKIIADQTSDYTILRTSWIYSSFGQNFVRTILSLAKHRGVIDIVADQRGAPTSALDIAEGIVAVARNLINRPNEEALRGLFHMTAAGETTWAGFGEAIFAASKEAGGPFATIRPIASKDYMQAAKRPANSRLDCKKIAQIHGVRLPDWRSSLNLSVEQIVNAEIAG